MRRNPLVAWISLSLNLAHGVVAFGIAYLLTNLTLIYHTAAPGSAESVISAAVWIAGVIFEITFIVYVVLRKRKIRRIWRDATQATREGDFVTARALAAQLLAYWEYKLNPAPVYFAMAVASEGMEQSREAQVLYRRAGDYPPALINLGVLMLERGGNDRAAEALRRYIARVPQDLSAVVLLSIALYRGGKAEAAKGVLKKRLAQRPNSPLLKRNLEKLELGEEPALSLQPVAKPESK
ncbi:hypothetical protein PLCT2_01853 [Planctomycetaceae bacterium]|nr:hypothetical protein PLCT2_01853 [Planctomycetaceae bacterium]